MCSSVAVCYVAFFMFCSALCLVFVFRLFICSPVAAGCLALFSFCPVLSFFCI